MTSGTFAYLCGMPKRLREKRLVMALHAFFDESGLNPNEDKVLILAGFLGRVEEWERAANAWDESLNEFPRIEYFSHRKAQSLEGPFEGWSRGDADAKVRSLARVITRFKLLGVCAGVPYEALSPRDQRISHSLMGLRYYDWAFLAATKGVLEYVNRHFSNEKVDFVFDYRKELRACISTYYQMRDEFDVDFMRCAGQCNPGNDRDTPVLQMADLLAWECSYTVKTEIMTDAFDMIYCSNRVLTIPCQPPALLNPTLELGKMGQDIQSKARGILQRFYGDKERSFELLSEAESLEREKEQFELYLKSLEDIHLQDEGYTLFIEKL